MWDSWLGAGCSIGMPFEGSSSDERRLIYGLNCNVGVNETEVVDIIPIFAD